MATYCNMDGAAPEPAAAEPKPAATASPRVQLICPAANPLPELDANAAHSGDADFASPLEEAGAKKAGVDRWPREEAVLRFGVVADVQYADLDIGQDFMKTVTRYYRHALDGLRMAVDCWNEQEVSFVAQLGDLIDGKNKEAGACSALQTQRGPQYRQRAQHELLRSIRA